MSRRRTPEQVVREFCGVWERGELERFADFVAEDAVFHMVPLAPARGLAAIREECRKLDELGRVRVEIRHLAAAGPVVFTERLDHLRKPDHSGALPVVGVFEVRDGRIVAWRDYFDLRQALDAFGLEAPF
jgi:limonene-1,2-epoxide hydrolase